MSGEHPAIGKSWAPATYAVGREKIREYANAVGETEPLYLDVEVARAAGHADVVAPPMFAVVYAAPAIAPALFDPEIGIDFARMVHGGQEFTWERLVVAGDELTTTGRFATYEEKGAMRFYALETQTVDAAGELVVTGLWTNIVRGG